MSRQSRPLKSFHLDNAGMPGAEVMDLLGAPKHVTQAHMVIFAATKVAASALCESMFPGGYRPRDFLADEGNNTQALIAAGLASEPGVYVMPGLAHAGAPVVHVVPAPDRPGLFKAAPVIVGHLAADGYRHGTHVNKFVPAQTPVVV